LSATMMIYGNPSGPINRRCARETGTYGDAVILTLGVRHRIHMKFVGLLATPSIMHEILLAGNMLF
ncbi:MAG TPA: hypothetical protein VGT44_22850, partial [Ktedonobacteraceae bacterium]|nr:hypothetical protein [Ktedonobacteraceae bacterium]